MNKYAGEDAIRQLIGLIKAEGIGGGTVSADTIWYGDSSPVEPSKYQFWLDSSNNLKIRRDTDDGYTYEAISLGNASAIGGDAKLSIGYDGESNFIIQSEKLSVSNSAVLKFRYISKDNSGDRIGCKAVWKRNNVVVATQQITQSHTATDDENERQSFDATKYLRVGENTITLDVTDDLGRTANKVWHINVIDMKITLDSDDTLAMPSGNSIAFAYKPIGSVSKNIYFEINNNTYTDLNNRTSGSTLTYNIPSQGHGAYLLKCYAEADFGGQMTPTEPVYQRFIWYDVNNPSPIVACNYDYNTYGTVSVRQYDTVNIKYSVYQAGKTSHVVKINDRGNISEVTHEQASGEAIVSGIYSFKSNEASPEGEPYVVTISCGDQSVSVKIQVSKLAYNISSVAENLGFEFDPANVVSNKWSYTNADNETTNLVVSDNFDWYNGGIMEDEDKNLCLCVKSGTRATFTYDLFRGNNTDFNYIQKFGTEFKLIFKTVNASNPNAEFLRCVDPKEDAKFVMNLTKAILSPNDSTRQITASYCEEERIEFDFNIDSITDSSSNSNRKQMVTLFEDGVPHRGGVISSDDFKLKSDIVIGSDDCDVYIYKMRAYKTSLDDESVLKNFIADAPNSEEAIARYERNELFDDNKITPESVAKICPDLRIITIEAPYFTSSKSDFVKYTTVTCTYPNGDFDDANWTATNCYHSGQGTTSDGYGNAGRNIDIIMCAGDKKRITSKIDDKPEENTLDPDTPYKTKIVLGDGVTPAKNGKVQLSKTSVPNDWFNIKVNIASSENANNALLQKRYDKFLPYKPLSKLRDSNSKTTMEFFNCVIFIKESSPNINSHNEFLDNEWHFYALGNIGDSKKTDESRANDPEDKNEFVVEIKDNPLPNAIFQTGVSNLPFKFGDNISSERVKSFCEKCERVNDRIIIRTLTREEYDIKTRLPIVPDEERSTTTIYITPSITQNISNLIWWTGTNFEIFASSADYFYFDKKYADRLSYRFLESGEYDSNTLELKITDKNMNKLYLVPVTNYYYKVYTYNLNHNDGYDLVFVGDSIINYDEVGELVYPIPTKFWNEHNNSKKTLGVMDGDNCFTKNTSFSFRYGVGGSAKSDVESLSVNLTSDKKKEQNKINIGIWLDFYYWVITASDEDFKNNIDSWVNKDAMLYFYLFTERFAMMDNRAKNTFWHFGKNGEFKSVSKENLSPAKLSTYYESKSGNYTKTKDTVLSFDKTYYEMIYTFRKVLNPNPKFLDLYYTKENDGEYRKAEGSFNGAKTYYWCYSFDMWDYDNDSSIGIDNSGGLTIPYGQEEFDKDKDGKYYFNGAQSVIWNRIRGLFQDELNTLFLKLTDKVTTVEHGEQISESCFECNDVINAFDKWQSQIPEKLWLKDIERKMYRPTFELSIDNSKPKKDDIFMNGKDIFMNGKKKYHRKQWERDQYGYVYTKYPPTKGNNEGTLFRVAETSNVAVTITAYSDMYVTAFFGESGVPNSEYKYSRRILAGESYVYRPKTSSGGTDTTTYIVGGERISAITGLENYNTQLLSLTKGKRMKKIKLGDSAAGASNNNQITSFSVAGLPVLEELDISNCVNINTIEGLNTHTNLKKLYANGANSLSSFVFAPHGKIEYVELPDSMTRLELRNIDNLYFDNPKYDNGGILANFDKLSALVDDNSAFQELEILMSYDSNTGLYQYPYFDSASTNYKHLKSLELSGVNWVLDDASLLNAIMSWMKDSDNTIKLRGDITINKLTSVERDNIEEAFPSGINFHWGEIIPYHVITYLDAEGNVWKTIPIADGQRPQDPSAYPVFDNIVQHPIKAETPTHTFAFAGWDLGHNIKVTTDLTYTPQYTPFIKKFNVRFLKSSGQVVEVHNNIDAGSTISYQGENKDTLTDAGGIWMHKWYNNANKSQIIDGTVTNILSNMDFYAVRTVPVMPRAKEERYDYLYSSNPDDYLHGDGVAYDLANFYWILVNNKAEEYFSLGDKIHIYNSSKIDVVMELADFYHYELAGVKDEEGNAVMAQTVWCTKNVVALDSMYDASSTQTNAIYLSNARHMQSTLNGYYNKFNFEFIELIKQVNLTNVYAYKRQLLCWKDFKYEDGFTTSFNINPHVESVFLLSYYSFTTETGSRRDSDNSKNRILQLYNSGKASRIKTYNGTPTSWWLRSGVAIDTGEHASDSVAGFRIVNPDGSLTYTTNFTSPLGVVFGFCI